MNTSEITFKCGKCGKAPKIDIEKSTENWTVYKTVEPCECGGKFEMCFGGEYENTK